MNQPINETNKQTSINQKTNKPTICQSINWSNKQTNNPLIKQKRSIKQTNKTIKKTEKHIISQSIQQTINQSKQQSKNKQKAINPINN